MLNKGKIQMMQITHAASAAALGTQVQNIYLAFIGGILIHFLIDKIPHYWPHTKKGKKIMIFLDHSITYAVFGFLVFFNQLSGPIIAAVLGALMVDLILVGVPLLYRGPVGQWHTKRQLHNIRYPYLATDLVVSSASILFIYLGMGR
jgi:hypothetical protein